MARTNRISVPDGIYHVSSRIANREFLLGDESRKANLVGLMYGVAHFSGVDVLSWCVMDNHFHMLVHVPKVPREYWLDSETEPASHAYTMRPPECEFPRWTPEGTAGDSPSSAGDCPYPIDPANRDKPFWVALEKIRAFRPPVGFMLTDEQMRDRIVGLYGEDRAEKMYGNWQYLREHGMGEAVDAKKTRLCRRMYNISQFVKTLKETFAMRYNREFRHEGCLWQGRFHSGVVEDDLSVKSVVAAYVEYNPCRAGIVTSPERWNWSSYGMAVSGGRYSERCRLGYERLTGLPWEEVRALMEAIFDDKGPSDAAEDEIVTASQAVHRGNRAFSRGSYIGRSKDFLAHALESVPSLFPRPSEDSFYTCLKLHWGIASVAA